MRGRHVILLEDYCIGRMSRRFRGKGVCRRTEGQQSRFAAFMRQVRLGACRAQPAEERVVAAASVMMASADWRFHAEAHEVLARDRQLRCVGSVREIHQLVHEARARRPDVLLFDAQMQAANEAPVLPGVHAVTPATKIVLFLDLLDERLIIDAIDQGAEGCVLKASTPEHWLQALRAVLGGDVWISRRLLFDALLRRLREGSARPHPLAARLDGLTLREREIVGAVQRGLSNKEIARRLEICPTTVKTHLQHVFGKLGISNRTQLLVPIAGEAA